MGERRGGDISSWRRALQVSPHWKEERGTVFGGRDEETGERHKKEARKIGESQDNVSEGGKLWGEQGKERSILTTHLGL